MTYCDLYDPLCEYPAGVDNLNQNVYRTQGHQSTAMASTYTEMSHIIPFRQRGWIAALQNVHLRVCGTSSSKQPETVES